MKHLLWSLAALALLLGFAAETPAHAANCAGYTYTLTNGQTADATQVMSNFNTIMSCANSSLAKSGANADITSLSALSTPLSVSQGGTGQATSIFSSNNTWGGTALFNGAATFSSSATFSGSAAFTPSSAVNLYASTTGSDASNTCTSIAAPCTARGAVTQATKWVAGGRNVTVNLAAGTYDTSIFLAGALMGEASTSLTDAAQVAIVGASSATTTINPTSGGGGCAQGYGDGITLSNYGNLYLDKVTIGTTCTNRSGLFIQNFAYTTIGPDVVWGSASVQMVHVEAHGYFEVPAASPFTVASGATAASAIGMSTNSVVNFDGNQINFNGNATFSDSFIYESGNSTMQLLSGTTVNLGGHAVTGYQYHLDYAAMLVNAAGVSLPGSSSLVLSGSTYYSPSTGFEFGGTSLTVLGGWNVTGGPLKTDSYLTTSTPVTVSAATYTIGSTESGLICTNAASCALTFPLASGVPGRRIRVKTTGGGTVVASASIIVPLAGGAAGSAIVSATAGKWAELQSDGTNWVIMAGN